MRALMILVLLMSLLVGCTPPAGDPARNPQKQALAGPYIDLLGMTAAQVEQKLGKPTKVDQLDENTVCWDFDSIEVGVCLNRGKAFSVSQEAGWITPTLKVGDSEEQVRKEIGEPLLRLTPNGKQPIAIGETDKYTVHVIVREGKASSARLQLPGGDD